MSTQTSTNTTNATDREKVLTLEEFKALQFTGNAVEIDPTEDAWEYSAPPERGYYDLKLNLAKDGLTITSYERDLANKFFKFNLECRIKSDNPDFDDIPVFANVTTRVGKRKKISTAVGLILKLGYKLPKTVLSDKEVAGLLLQVLKKEPIIKTELDWKASYKFTNKKGEDEWKNVYNSYDEFPEHHRVAKFSVPDPSGNGVIEVRPQLFVAKWFGKGETLPPLVRTSVVNGTGPVLAQPVMQSQPVMAQPTMVAPTAQTPQFVAPPVQQQTAPSDDMDISLMLQE